MSADVPPMNAARERSRREAQDEYRRLLYVGMTRAAEHLIICGAQGLNGKPTGCWYDLVYEALAAGAVSEPAIDGDGTVLRWHGGSELPPSSAPSSAGAPIEVPAWLSRKLDRVPDRAPTLFPSRSVDSRLARPGGHSERNSGARLRGRLAHRLLQSLPEIPVDQRAAAARRYLQRAAREWADPEREALVAEVLAVLDDPRCAALFGPDSRAEVPIRGRLDCGSGLPVVVSGQVDRLAVSDNAVLIVDYKTDRPAPRGPEHVPPGYLTQLALYRAVLDKIYPGRTIRAALIWTETVEFCELPPAALDAALARLVDRAAAPQSSR